MKKLFLISALVTTIGLCANPTDDLFLAIEHGNIQAVSQALEKGADTRSIRIQDGHSPRTLAQKYAHSNLFYFLSAFGAIPLFYCSATKNLTTTAAALGAGLIIPSLEKAENKQLQKLDSMGLGLGKLIGTAALGTLIFNAAQSDYPKLAAIGILSVLNLAQNPRLTKWQKIYRLVCSDDFQLNTIDGIMEPNYYTHDEITI